LETAIDNHATGHLSFPRFLRGAIGRPLVHRRRANQHEAFALTRSPGSAPLNEIGAEPVIADALDAAALKAAAT
jgi:hypothetical protein